MRLLFVALSICAVLSCKKNNGGTVNPDSLEGRFVIKTAELCGGANFVGQKLSGNNTDREITLTLSDSLNSWYIKKYGTDYLIYAKQGINLLIWNKGGLFTVNTGPYHALNLLQSVSLPAVPSDEMLFTITQEANGTFTFKNKSLGWYVQTYKGGPKNSSNCTRQRVPVLDDDSGCADVMEGNVELTICYLKNFSLVKIN